MFVARADTQGFLSWYHLLMHRSVFCPRKRPETHSLSLMSRGRFYLQNLLSVWCTGGGQVKRQKVGVGLKVERRAHCEVMGAEGPKSIAMPAACQQGLKGEEQQRST